MKRSRASRSGPPTPTPVPAARRSGLPGVLHLLLFPVLAAFLLAPVLFGDRVLLPAEYLAGFSPWTLTTSDAERRALPQWNVLQWDGMAEFFPWRLHAVRAFARGHVPLWNPHVLCGTPFLANSQSAPLYPLHSLLYLPFGPETAVRLGWLAFLHLSLAGLFTYVLARDLGVRSGAALIAGTAFELSGFAVAWLELPSFLAVACWIPLFVLCVRRACRHGCGYFALAAGTAGGLMVLAGHVQIAFYGLLAGGCATVLAVIRSLRDENDIRRAAQQAGLGGVAVGVAFALAAPQFLPTLELSRMSHRVSPPSAAGYSAYAKLALPPQHWITLIAPDYYGLPGRSDFWGFWNYGAPNTMEYAGHVGAVALLLALIGLALGRRVGEGPLFAGLLVVLSLLLATDSPLARFFYFFVPGFSQSGSPARALVLLCLAQALLAALGTEALLRRAQQGWHSVLGPCMAALAALVLLTGAAQLIVQSRLDILVRGAGPMMADIALPAVGRALGAAAATVVLVALLSWLLRDRNDATRIPVTQGALLLGAASTLLPLAGSYNLTASRAAALPETPLTRRLQSETRRVATLNHHWDIGAQAAALLPPNVSLAYGWRDVQGYDSLYLNSFRRLANALHPTGNASPAANGNIVYLSNPTSPLFPFLAAPVILSQDPLHHPTLVPETGYPPGPPYAYRHTAALPEAYLAESVQSASDDEALAVLARLRPARYGRAAVLGPGSETRFVANPTSSHSAGPETDPVVERNGSGRIRVTGSTANPTLLVLCETFAPGWRATLWTGAGAPQPVRIQKVNVAFQGIAVPAGEFRVEYRYEPDSFRIGLFAALGAIALLAGAATSLRFASPKRG